MTTKKAACQQLFDDIDVFYLANTLSTAQLRRELHHAEVEVAVDLALSGTEFQDSFPWMDYAAVCREALIWQRPKQRQSQPQPGHIDTEAIKANNDIVVVIEGYTTLRKSGRNFTGRCPIHNDKNPSLTVYPDRQTWHCFGACDRGGDIFSFIMAAANTDFRGAAAILGGK